MESEQKNRETTQTKEKKENTGKLGHMRPDVSSIKWVNPTLSHSKEQGATV